MLRTKKTGLRLTKSKQNKKFDFSPIKIKATELQMKLIALIPRSRTSNPVSAILRPIFEHKNLKSVLGTQIAALMLAIGASGVSTSAFGLVPADVHDFANTIEVSVVTNKTFAYPVENVLGMSQGYHVFHPGVDIRAPLGSSIHPVEAGKVSLVKVERYGYGRHVEVTHEDGSVSLYAHMGKIYVEEGEIVTTTTTLGDVGLTGRTTGPHLHLEIHTDEGKALNPLTVIEKKSLVASK